MYAYQTAHPLWSLPWRANFTFTWWPAHPRLQRPSRWSRRDIPPEWRHTLKPPEFRRSRTRCWERCRPSTGTCSSEAWTLWMRVRTGCQDRFLSTLYVPLIFYLNTHWGDFNSSSNSCFLRDTTFAFSFMSCQTLYNIIWQALIYIAFTFNTTEFWPSHPVGPPLIDFFQECASPFHEVSVILKVALSEVRTELHLELMSPCSWTDHSGRQSCKYPCTPPRCPPFRLFLLFSTFLW